MPDIITSLHTLNQGALLVAVQILATYNCRASEVLSATWHNFFYPHMLILKGKKKSRDIIIRDKSILSAINNMPRIHSHYIFYPLTYSQIYNYVKSNYSHLFLQFKTKKNHKVTHGWRYLYAQLSSDSQTVKSILHHNSSRSGKFYNKKLS